MEAFPQEIRFYETADGKVPAREWLDSIEGTPAYGAISVALEKVQLGNFGDHRAVGEGVNELRIDFGPGYRVYYGRVGNEMVVLLVGGSKQTQNADIETAKEYWRDFSA